MNKVFFGGVVFWCLLAALANLAASGVPQFMNYQGRLTDSTGRPVDGPVDMEFAFYDVDAGGVPLAPSQFLADVPVSGGVFNVMLDVSPGVFDHAAVYLSVTVNGEELLPRERLVSVAYAFRSDQADYAGEAALAGYAATAHSASTANNAAVADNAELLDWMDSTAFAKAAHSHSLAEVASDSEVLAAVKNVDGSGSGLDADMVDGLHVSDLDGRYVNVVGDTMTGPLDVNATLSCTDLTVDWDATVDRMLEVAPDGIGAILVGDVKQFVANEDVGVGYCLRADSSLYLGSTDHHGSIYARNIAGTTTFTVDGANGNVSSSGNVTAEGDMSCFDLTVDWDATVDRILEVAPDGIGGITVGDVKQFVANGDVAAANSLKADKSLYAGSSNYNGHIYAKNTSGTTTFEVDGSDGDITTSGDLNTSAGYGIDLSTASGDVWQFYGSSATDSKQLRLIGPTDGEFLLDASWAVIQLGGSNLDTVKIPADIDGGIVVFENASGGANAAAVRAENTNAGGIAVTGRVTSTDACTVFINKGTGDIIRGFSGATGGDLVFRVLNSGRVVCTALQITGGGDLAEPFDVGEAEKVEPGMVVAIDPDRPGRLRLATKAYDRTVAGVVSGANGVKPGLTMKQEGTAADGSLPVALTGRAYCWCDAANGPIRPGDLLTTADTPGHAMKVTDHERATGAVIGKAMTSLEKGRGLVLTLVTLQ